MITPQQVPHHVDPELLEQARVPRLLQDRITGIVIASFFAVHRELGAGYVEAVYQRALSLEFSQRGLSFEQEASLSVFYKGAKVGHHRAAFLVEGRVVVDLGAGDRLDPGAERDFTSSLKASGCDGGLFLHFGPTPRFRHVDRCQVGATPCITIAQRGPSEARA